MISTDSIVAVTGAGGFIGHAICRRLIADQVRVRAMVRYRSDLPGEFQFDLGSNIIDPVALEGPVRAMVHCAWDERPRSLEEARRLNVEGTQWLIDRCRKAGVEQFVLISSLTADSGAESVYGRTKWEAEQLLLSRPDAATFSTVIAAGMVIGNGGTFARNRAVVRRHKVVPIYYQTQHQRLQTVHVDDLCGAIVASISGRITGRLFVAEEKGVTLRDFYRGLALLEQKELMLPRVPGGMALVATRALEAVGLKPTVSSNQLLGIKHMRHVDTTESIKRLGIAGVSDFWQSIERLVPKDKAAELTARLRKLAAGAPGSGSLSRYSGRGSG
jgi:nucleoside-diphosphate-sugar epimerase